MNENLILLFALSVLYAVIGNVFVYGILIRRKFRYALYGQAPLVIFIAFVQRKLQSSVLACVVSH